ncbi:MAG: hypothetical protein PHP42_09940 [Bacteroidota bacterium]|nr:hypothetical protein [Bacteroidota bacterium]
MKHLLAVAVVLLTLNNFSRAQSIQNDYVLINYHFTQADIINAATLVDPLAEKIKDIPSSTFNVEFKNIKGNPLMINMSVKGWVTLEEDQRHDLIVEAHTTVPFLIPRAGRIFTAKDADNPSSGIHFNINVNEELKKKLKDKVLDPTSGGRVPSGFYEIFVSITVVSDSGKSIASAPLEFTETASITNPTTAMLDVPFSNGYVYPTPFPQFQWTYDTRFALLSVYEKRPEHQSLEDAIAASDPYLQIKIDRRLSGNLTSFTYPQSPTSRPGVEFLRGPRQLERGKMYVVVLDGIVTTLGIDVDPIRTIRSFVIADPQGQAVINLLQALLSSGDYQSIFNLIEDQNLILNTNGITLNGMHISPQDLQQLLTKNKDHVISVHLGEN